MDTMQTQHKELLQAQLASLRQEILSQASSVPINGQTEVLQLNSSGDQTQDEVGVQETLVGRITGLEIINVPLQPEQVDLRGQLVEFGHQEDTLSSLECPRSDTALTEDLEVKQEVSLVSRKRRSEEDCKGMSERKVPHVS